MRVCIKPGIHTSRSPSLDLPSSVMLWSLPSAAQHGHWRGRPLVQHLREVAELGQLPGPPHAGALRGEALQVHRVRTVFHHQREHAQVGAGGFHLLPRVQRLTASRVASQLSSQRLEEAYSCAEEPEPVSSACRTVSSVSEVSAHGASRTWGLVSGWWGNPQGDPWPIGSFFAEILEVGSLSDAEKP